MIIAHNSNDYDEFQKLLTISVSELQKDSKKRTEYYINRGGIDLEKDVYHIVNNQATNTMFANNIELISGQKFPDIVAYVNKNKAYGIEVKTTKQNKWKSTGSSIFEGTRVENVQNIHLLFGKLSDPVEFKCRKYEDCLYDVAITHSPRYLIDMDVTPEKTIFSKVGVDYNTLRQSPNPFQPIKSYFRKNLKQDEDIWWIDQNEESTRDLTVRLWGNLKPDEKDKLRVKALAHFPSLLGNGTKKYTRLATWLVSQFGIVNHALRDTFTAGGQVEIQGVKFPKIFNHLVQNKNEIFSTIETQDEEDLKYYWEVESLQFPKKEFWKKMCLSHCKDELNKDQLQIIQNLLNA